MNRRVTLGHGAGGQMTSQLVRDLFLKRLGNQYLAPLADSAVLPAPTASRLAFTTDGFVVTPLFFPGGDIGKIAVYGTVNDLAVSGATPLYLAASFIIEEGLSLDTLERVVDSMALAASQAGVAVVAGDTKVVERGSCDALFIATSGVGAIPPGLDLGPGRVRAGDVLVLSGAVGDHGIAVLSGRPGLSLETTAKSDCAPVSGLTAKLLEHLGPAVRWMRDPTRGGLATVSVELAEEAGLAVVLDEAAVPVHEEVRTACEALGLDALYLANEGKVLSVIDAQAADEAVRLLREAGQTEAAIVGRVEAVPGPGAPGSGAAGPGAPGPGAPDPSGSRARSDTAPWALLGRGAYLKSVYGGTRPLSRLTGEQLPRIC